MLLSTVTSGVIGVIFYFLFFLLFWPKMFDFAAEQNFSFKPLPDVLRH